MCVGRAQARPVGAAARSRAVDELKGAQPATRYGRRRVARPGAQWHRFVVAGAGAALVAVAMTACANPQKTRGPAESGAAAPRLPISTDQRWPSSIAGRKILDQHGDVYLLRTFSSWAMAMNLTDAEITQALEGVAGRGFNGVTVWAGGGYDVGDGWDRYTTVGHGAWWAGKPWASALGPGWDAMDRVMDEALRLGLTVNFSFCGGNGSTGARPDWEAATDQDM